MDVVKIGLHSDGEEIHPMFDHRVVHQSEMDLLKDFIARSIPSLKDASIVYTRKCLYTDTLDGHYWIDRHPNIEGITIATGGCGHGFKMGPVLGDLVAHCVTGENSLWTEVIQNAMFGWKHVELVMSTLCSANAIIICLVSCCVHNDSVWCKWPL